MGKNLFFDLDGTIYPIKEGNFKKSSMYKDMKSKTIKFISQKKGISVKDAQKIFDYIIKKYDFILSEGLDKEYNISKKEYFEFAWNMDPSKHLEKDTSMGLLLQRLSKNYNLFILSDAPTVWILNVLKYLGIKKFFKKIYSGGDLGIRKISGLFSYVLKDLRANINNCFMIGDEEIPDIITPKKQGFKTIFVGKDNNNLSDYNIKKLKDLHHIL